MKRSKQPKELTNDKRRAIWLLPRFDHEARRRRKIEGVPKVIPCEAAII